jgi:hypothetical protein
MKRKRLHGKVLWFCALACLCSLGVTAHEIFAQAPVSSTSTGQLGISPEEPVAPPKPIIITSPAPRATNSAPKAGQNAGSGRNAGGGQDAAAKVGQDAGLQSSQDVEAAKVEMPAIPNPDPNNPVAVQSASLLKMAYDLKSEVDKTTKDTLSVTVVRRAAEIEQLARKMRAK